MAVNTLGRLQRRAAEFYPGSNRLLCRYMSDYNGLDEFEPAVDFIKRKFLDRRKDPEKRVYVHVTCATDTSNVRFVFDSVVSIILEENMKASGLI